MVVKIVAIAGSNSSNSINRKLVTFVSGLFKGVEVETFDLNDFPMPLFGVDIEKEIGSPPSVDKFIMKLNEASLVLLSLPENNRMYSAAFKSLFDWVSRKTPKVFQGRPVFLMSASTGKRGGASVLEVAEKHLPNYGAEIRSVFSFPLFNENFDQKKGIINGELLANLKELVEKLEVDLKGTKQ